MADRTRHSRLGGIALAVSLAALGMAGPAAAHPHVWVTSQTTVIYENGAIAALKHRWLFDEFYTAGAVEGLDKNKDGFLTQAEFNEIVTLGPGGPRPGDNTPTQPQFASPKSATAVKTTERAASPEELAFFESKIRPVLVEKCYKCHAAGEGNKIKGGLALDTREGARKGGDSGPAVVPGDAKKSLLLEAIQIGRAHV